MKPMIKNHTLVLPHYGVEFYPESQKKADRENFGIDLSDAIYAVISNLPNSTLKSTDGAAEDLVDTAIDVYEGVIKHPEFVNKLSDETAAYWATTTLPPRVRVNELLALAEAFLLPFRIHFAKVGDIVGVECLREISNLVINVHLVVDKSEGEPPRNVNWHLPNTLPLPIIEGSRWDITNPVNSLPQCKETKVETTRDSWMPIPDFFTSLKAKYIHALTELDSVTRMKALNITPILYDNRESAKMWFTKIAKEIGALDGTVGRDIEDASFRAYTNLCNIYARMLEVPSGIAVTSDDTF